MSPEEKVEKIRDIVRSDDEPMEEALRELFQWTPQSGNYPLQAVSDIVTGKDSGYYGGEGRELYEEECPFFTEAFLYPLLGKEDARNLLALVRSVIDAAGFNRHEDYRRWVEEAMKETRERIRGTKKK